MTSGGKARSPRTFLRLPTVWLQWRALRPRDARELLWTRGLPRAEHRSTLPTSTSTTARAASRTTKLKHACSPQGGAVAVGDIDGVLRRGVGAVVEDAFGGARERRRGAEPMSSALARPL